MTNDLRKTFEAEHQQWWERVGSEDRAADFTTSEAAWVAARFHATEGGQDNSTTKGQ